MLMRVRDYEVDSQGIVNNAVYLHYLEHTRHEFCREAGTSFRSMQSEGIDPVLRRVDIEYLTLSDWARRWKAASLSDGKVPDSCSGRRYSACPTERLWYAPT